MGMTDAVARILQREGVEHLTAYPNNPVIEAAAAAGIRPIIVRQERSSVHMAGRLAGPGRVEVRGVRHKAEQVVGTPESEVKQRENAEAAAAARLADEGISSGSGSGPSQQAKPRSSACIAPTAKPSSTVCSVLFPCTTGCMSSSPRWSSSQRPCRAKATVPVAQRSQP
jgi:hypothetical protein